MVNRLTEDVFSSDTDLEAHFQKLFPRPSATLSPGVNGKPVRSRRLDEKPEVILKRPRSWRPDNWSLSVTAKSRLNWLNAKDDEPWQSSVRASGNEKLEFTYNPQRAPSLKLITKKLTRASKEVAFSNGPHQLSLDLNKEDDSIRPVVQLAKSGDANTNELTAAPALAVLKLTQRDAADKGHSTFVQDFNLPRQKQSNVHDISFPTINRWSVLGNKAIFPDKSDIDVECYLLARFGPAFWTHDIALGTGRSLKLPDAEEELSENPVDLRLYHLSDDRKLKDYKLYVCLLYTSDAADE